jgi:hypothetical protein
MSAKAESGWTTLAALSLVVLGALLRLHGLAAMEFKGDEQAALDLGIGFLQAQPSWSPRSWPTYGIVSSNGVANAPLFTWIVAAAWAVTRHPVGVTRMVALSNALCLYPLWLWARRRMDQRRALCTLALAAVSPFAVIFSRKIWNCDMLLPGVLAVLWGIEWMRGERPWRGVALLLVAGLLVGQLHLSGAIALVFLPVAIGVQRLADRRRGTPAIRPGRPSTGEIAAMAIAIALNLVFWLSYLRYLRHVPPEAFVNRPTLDFMSPQLLEKVAAQVAPVDLFYFFSPDRGDFLQDAVRSVFFYGAVGLGAPLFLYGLWRWCRSPLAVPVVGVWWWCVIGAFTLARIPCHPHYVLTLAPLPALLVAGAFDGPRSRAWITRVVDVWRLMYVVALLGLTIVTQAWLASRGGAAGDYGVIYAVREAQAKSIVSRIDSRLPGRAYGWGEVRPEEGLTLGCGPVPVEVNWIARWLEPQYAEAPATRTLCDNWIEQRGRLVYRWTVRDLGRAR